MARTRFRAAPRARGRPRIRVGKMGRTLVGRQAAVERSQDGTIRPAAKRDLRKRVVLAEPGDPVAMPDAMR